MNRDIDLIRQQSFFDLFGKHPFAANVGDRPIDQTIAAGFDDAELDFNIKMLTHQLLPHPCRLGNGESAAAAAEPDAPHLPSRSKSFFSAAM